MPCLDAGRLFPQTGNMANNKRSLQTRLVLGHGGAKASLHMIPGDLLAMPSRFNVSGGQSRASAVYGNTFVREANGCTWNPLHCITAAHQRFSMTPSEIAKYQTRLSQRMEIIDKHTPPAENNTRGQISGVGLRKHCEEANGHSGFHLHKLQRYLACHAPQHLGTDPKMHVLDHSYESVHTICA